MSFSDNPRKLYGRVEISYTDADISQEITAFASENSEISHTDEVHKSNLTPTVKACTMDGNSIMDGTFQMMDESCVCGWWSGSVSSSDGTLTNHPYLQLTFPPRPIFSWIVLGDSKLGQYPKDFTITFYKNSTVLGTEEVTNNTQLSFKLFCSYQNVTSIRLTVNKWSTPFACAKIMQFYDSLSERYEGSDLQSFEVLEEMSNQEGSYGLSSDSATVLLYNRDRKFDKGYLKELLLPNRKLKFYIGCEENDEITYTLLGTFYSDYWSCDQTSQWVKCSCSDKLLILQNTTYLGFNLKENATLYEIAEDIIQNTGFKSYEISSSLKDIIVPKAYLTKMTAWEALQNVAFAGLCQVYIDREDNLVIRSESDSPKEGSLVIDKSNMFSFQSEITKSDYSNQISVSFFDVELSENDVEASSCSVTLGPYESLDLIFDFSRNITSAYATNSNPETEISRFKSNVNAASLRITNTLSIEQKSTISIFGKELKQSSKTVVLEDEQSILLSGVIQYTHPTSTLIQSSERAQEIASYLLEKMKTSSSVVKTTWRGDPDLALSSQYTAKDRFDDSSTLICEYNKFSFDGKLRQESRGRKI